MVDLITEHIATWTAAQIPQTNGGRGRGRGANGKSPHGIKKLRELILELAVRGKLVPQDSNDESANVLLEKITKEKARLTKAGKIKKQKPQPKISADEIPFGLPIGWVWQRLGDLGFTQTGGTPSKTNQSLFGEDVPFIKPGDIYPTHVDYSNEGLSFAGQEALGRTAQKGSILMVCIGTIGKCNSIDRDCTFNQQINSLSPYLELTDFLLAALRSNYFQTAAWEKSSSTTIAILNKGNWAEIIVPLAPLAEQQRIVAKVDELMALCDKLEQQQTDSSETHQTLVETLLATLTTITDQAEFALSWQRIEVHFDTLLTTEASINQLKQTILQLAVMGKLVPQDPNDEPASTLLEKITKEKARLIKDGKIKKQKPQPKISEDEKPFDLPEGWECVRLNDVLDVRDGTHDTPKYVEIGYPLITSKNLYTGKLSFEDVKFISEEDHKRISERSAVDVGDILFAMIGSIGNPVIVDSENEFSIKNVALFKFYIAGIPDKRYLHYFLTLGQENMKDTSSGAVQSFVSLGFLRSYLYPLPPLAEQHRIVAKVDELMALCDTLKERLHDAQTTQVQLADVIVKQAVA